MKTCAWKAVSEAAAQRLGHEPECEGEAVVVLGTRREWSVCAACAEGRLFRRFRVARVLATHDALRRDSAGWWIDAEGVLAPPAPLAEVLARCALPGCPVHGWRPRMETGNLGIRRACPEPGCWTRGAFALDEEMAGLSWRRAVQAAETEALR